MTSDWGGQFVSELWSHLLAMFGIQAAHTTAYHPQANGLVERFHRQMKASLKAKLNSSNWFNELPLVLLGIRTALKQDLGCSAAEMVYGQTLRLPGEFFSASSEVAKPHVLLSRLMQA
jgi:transposase InsO family protein